jgi:hypothetical protein
LAGFQRLLAGFPKTKRRQRPQPHLARPTVCLRVVMLVSWSTGDKLPFDRLKGRRYGGSCAAKGWSKS